MGLVLWAGSLSVTPAGAQAGPPGTAVQPPTSSQAAPALTGKIAHITILGNKNIATGAILSILAAKIGDPYTPQAADKDLAALNGMGVFMKPASVSATPDPAGGVDLTYTVAEYPIVTAIKFTADTPTGEPSVPAADLRAQMKTKIGQVLNTDILVSDLNTLFARDTGYVAKHGRFADVSANMNIEPKTGVVTIPLVEYRVQTIQITGNKRVKTTEILAQMHTKTGDLYDAHAFGDDLSAIFEMGAFRSVKDYTWTITAPGKLTVTIPVVEREAATGVLDEKRGKTVPFRYDPLTAPYPVVQISINGRPSLPFVVDTGTDAALCLDTWAAKELGLKPTGPTETVMGAVAYRRVPIQSVVLRGTDRRNDVTFDTKEAFIFDLGLLSRFVQEPRVAGIVGLGMLLPVTTRFDFAARSLSIFADPQPPLSIRGGTVLPLRANVRQTFSVRATLGPDVFADLILDTGSTSTQFPLPVMTALKPTAIKQALTERLGGLYVIPEVRLPGLKLGTLWVSDIVLGSIPPPEPASLGMDILSCYRLTLDGPNGQAILEPLVHSERSETGWAGLRLRQAGDGWMIERIKPGSPAGPGGLQMGDMLLTVGGISAQGLPQFVMERMLAGLVGTPVRVTVRRAGQVRAASWLPVDYFRAPRDIMDGLTMQRGQNSPWTVLDVQKGSAADQAGLKTGDRITRMSGKLLSGLSQDQCVGLLDQSSLLLEVTRMGQAQPLSMKLSAPSAKP